ncbi:hypothetical protein J6590_044221 [Homalodisca vitripennis]|nr:hypothetical protein J6590_044221 [Homalodisca vitripennis]
MGNVLIKCEEKNIVKPGGLNKHNRLVERQVERWKRQAAGRVRGVQSLCVCLQQKDGKAFV